ncbi:GNAT family N-acetyltransferase isoform A [Micractinium conductrix]|uniref:GNAT family N-acetyltransferase isoform A n=1 Tax=Micractinium conductrix TaxID=554055 RepID=A0A2P6V5S8_9CHLO|nr:GNAT family N-acetyltransferase isoform A [Micractinium conductrix]|eukprot:PSC69430.1 GNAT family N-acetyltransferase isoform A [Micractinium conductrix]
MTTPPALEEVSDADVKRAMATISQALMADSVSLYLAAPGSEDSFHHAVMHSYLQSGQRQRFFHAADFGSTAARSKHLYLEASTPRSAALYARHGFVGVADKPLGGPGEEGAPVLRVMVRPPSSVAVSSA